MTESTPVTFALLERITGSMGKTIAEALRSDRDRIAQLEETVADLRRELEADR